MIFNVTISINKVAETTEMNNQIISLSNTKNFGPSPWKYPRKGKPVQEDSFIEFFRSTLQQRFSAFIQVHFSRFSCHF